MTGEVRHITAETLAEHGEGLLPAARSDEIAAHLDGCPDCQDIADRLSMVSMRLVDASLTLPIPPGVAVRLDTAIATAVAERDQPATENVRVLAKKDVPRWRRRLPQALAAAATVGVVGLAGYILGTQGAAGGDDAAMETALQFDADAGDGADVPESTADDSVSSGQAAAPYSADEEWRELAVPEAIRAEANLDQIGEVLDGRLEFVPNCGQRLSEDLGLELLGSAETTWAGTDAVLIVLSGSEAGTVQAWWMPSCTAFTAEAHAHLTAPRS